MAVVDTGMDYSHNDLKANVWVNRGELADNGVDDDGNGYVDDVRGWDFANGDNDPFDDHSHGTHVSGTLGASGNNGIGVAGVNWRVRIMPLKFLDQCGSGSTDDAVSAILYAKKMGAAVINASWGGGDSSRALQDAIKAFGGPFVAAAGNDGKDNDSEPSYPAAYPLPNIIAVAATDSNDLLADFSNYGASSVDLAAPGVDIYSTLPDQDYGLNSGTSMAAPHVTGAVALLKSYAPGLSTAQIKSVLMRASDKQASLRGKVGSGGRLNVYQALKAVRDGL